MEIFEKGEGRAGQGRVFWIDNIQIPSWGVHIKVV